jgi:hypothetical protein
LRPHRYNGANANKYEKAKGAEMVRKIHDERGARGTVVRFENAARARYLLI